MYLFIFFSFLKILLEYFFFSLRHHLPEVSSVPPIGSTLNHFLWETQAFQMHATRYFLLLVPSKVIFEDHFLKAWTVWTPPRAITS